MIFIEVLRLIAGLGLLIFILYESHQISVALGFKEEGHLKEKLKKIWNKIKYILFLIGGVAGGIIFSLVFYFLQDKTKNKIIEKNENAKIKIKERIEKNEKIIDTITNDINDVQNRRKRS